MSLASLSRGQRRDDATMVDRTMPKARVVPCTSSVRSIGRFFGRAQTPRGCGQTFYCDLDARRLSAGLGLRIADLWAITWRLGPPLNPNNGLWHTHARKRTFSGTNYSSSIVART